MNKTKLNIFSLSALALTLAAPSAYALDASNLLITVYGVAVSASLDCSNPIVVFDSTGGTQTDFMANPTIGGGDIPDGSYPCVMINMSDNITFTPSTSDGVNCVAGTQYTIDVCRAGSGSKNLRTGTTFGATESCTGSSGSPIADRVTLFLKTNADGSSGGFVKPTTTSDPSGIALTNAFVVSGSSSGKFVVDAHGKVSSGGGACGMDPPVFTFR